MIALTRRSTRHRYAARGQARTRVDVVDLERVWGPPVRDFDDVPAYLTPDGKILDHWLGEHRDAAEQQGLSTGEVLDLGIVRVRATQDWFGVQLRHPLTEAQIRRITTSRMVRDVDNFYVDVSDASGETVFSRHIATPTGSDIGRVLREANEAAA